eukprot:COSAG05_NODE_21896_length_268_cov_0.917160_1_plen_36_part_10
MQNDDVRNEVNALNLVVWRGPRLDGGPMFHHDVNIR